MDKISLLLLLSFLALGNCQWPWSGAATSTVRPGTGLTNGTEANATTDPNALTADTAKASVTSTTSAPESSSGYSGAAPNPPNSGPVNAPSSQVPELNGTQVCLPDYVVQSYLDLQKQVFMKFLGTFSQGPMSGSSLNRYKRSLGKVCTTNNELKVFGSVFVSVARELDGAYRKKHAVNCVKHRESHSAAESGKTSSECEYHNHSESHLPQGSGSQSHDIVITAESDREVTSQRPVQDELGSLSHDLVIRVQPEREATTPSPVPDRYRLIVEDLSRPSQTPSQSSAKEVSDDSALRDLKKSAATTHYHAKDYHLDLTEIKRNKRSVCPNNTHLACCVSDICLPYLGFCSGSTVCEPDFDIRAKRSLVETFDQGLSYLEGQVYGYVNGKKDGSFDQSTYQIKPGSSSSENVSSKGSSSSQNESGSSTASDPKVDWKPQYNCSS